MSSEKFHLVMIYVDIDGLKLRSDENPVKDGVAHQKKVGHDRFSG